MHTYCHVSFVTDQKHQHQIFESGWITHKINTTNELQEMDTLSQIRSSPTQYLQKNVPDKTAKSTVGKVINQWLSWLIS
jgi:hypothetical protein